jgi:Glycosyl hydrolases family 18
MSTPQENHPAEVGRTSDAEQAAEDDRAPETAQQPQAERADDNQASAERADDNQASAEQADDNQASAEQADDNQASAEQADDNQASAERAEDNQASKARDWFQPVFGPVPAPGAASGPTEPVPPLAPKPADAVNSPAKPAPSAPKPAGPAQPVPTFTPNPALSPARPKPTFTPNPPPSSTSPAKPTSSAKPASPAKPVPTFTPNPAPSVAAKPTPGVPAKPAPGVPAKPTPGVPAGPASPAEKAPSSRSDSAAAARPKVTVEDADTVVMPVFGGKRAQPGAPNAGDGSTAAGATPSQAAAASTTGPTPMLRAVSSAPVKRPQEPAYKPIKPDTRSRRTARAGRTKPPGSSVPPKRVPSLGGRLRSGFALHRLLIAALTVITVIVVTATLVSVRLDASPPPAGAPPMKLPAAGKAQVISLGAGTWPTTPAAAVPSACKQVSLTSATGASVVSFLDDNSKQQDLVAKEAAGLKVLDFSWTSLASATALAQSDQFDPSLATELTAANHAAPCALRFVTVSDNATALSHSADVRMMTKILTDSTVRQQNVLAVAQWMASQPLATGLTIDYENGLPQNLSDLAIAEQTAGWSGLSLDDAVNRLSDDYTQLIGEIADAMHREHRLVRLMAPVRNSDDVDVATTDIGPYLLNYGALSQYVDQIVLKAYDFNFATGNPGPIAPFTAVAKVLAYVHSYGVSWGKLTVAAPLYAYDWTVNTKGGIALNAKGQPISATTLTATQVAADKKRWKEAKTENGETEYTYISAGQSHIVWDASSALKTEMAWLKQNYPQIGIDAWKIGNADPAGSALAVTILGS